MGNVYIDRDQVDVLLELFVKRDIGITGLTVECRIYDTTTNDFVDFADGVFKAAGHSTPTRTLPAKDATNAPGLYAILEDFSAFTIPASAETLVAVYEITAGGESGNGRDLFHLNMENLVHDANLAGHNIAGTAGKAALLNLYDNGEAVGVHIDATGGGTAGTALGTNGTVNNPVAGVADALAIATALGISTYIVRGSAIPLTADHPNWRFYGLGNSYIDAAGFELGGSQLNNCGLAGTVTTVAGFIRGFNGFFLNATDVEGTFDQWGLIGTLVPGVGGITISNGFDFQFGVPIIDCGPNATSADVFEYTGEMEIRGVTAFTTSLEFHSGRLTVGTGNTGGIIDVAGHVGVSGLGSGVTIDRSRVTIPATIDTVLSASHGAGSWVGTSANSIRDAILNADASTFLVIGSVGERIWMAGEHALLYYVDDLFVFGGGASGTKMTSMRRRGFDNKADALAQINVVTTQTVTATYVVATDDLDVFTAVRD